MGVRVDSVDQEGQFVWRGIINFTHDICYLSTCSRSYPYWWKWYEKGKMILSTAGSFYNTIPLGLVQVSKCLDSLILECCASVPCCVSSHSFICVLGSRDLFISKFSPFLLQGPLSNGAQVRGNSLIIKKVLL